jgi:hypothetical protein
MDDNLHQRYLAAARFHNGQVKASRRELGMALPLLSENEFRDWWGNISLDAAKKTRWLRRFDDPEAARNEAISEFVRGTSAHRNVRRVA